MASAEHVCFAPKLGGAPVNHTYVVLATNTDNRRVVFYIEAASLLDAYDAAAEMPKVAKVININLIDAEAGK
jgi:hypothetical protein